MSESVEEEEARLIELLHTQALEELEGRVATEESDTETFRLMWPLMMQVLRMAHSCAILVRDHQETLAIKPLKRSILEHVAHCKYLHMYRPDGVVEFIRAQRIEHPKYLKRLRDSGLAEVDEEAIQQADVAAVRAKDAPATSAPRLPDFRALCTEVINEPAIWGAWCYESSYLHPGVSAVQAYLTPQGLHADPAGIAPTGPELRTVLHVVGIGVSLLSDLIVKDPFSRWIDRVESVTGAAIRQIPDGGDQGASQ